MQLTGADISQTLLIKTCDTMLPCLDLVDSCPERVVAACKTSCESWKSSDENLAIVHYLEIKRPLTG